MSKKFTALGSAVLCVLALGALGASPAAAAETTAYTCVKGGTESFKDADCKEAVAVGTGTFGHVAIPEGESTQLTVKEVGNQTLAFEVLGSTVALEATGLECVGCHFENLGPMGAMSVVGTGQLKYTGVTVEKLGEKCRVKSDPGGVIGVIETEPLKFATSATNEVKIEPAAGAVLANFSIEALPGQKCNFVRTYSATGDVAGITSGATIAINVTKEQNTLKVNGEQALLQGEATLEGGLTGAAHHPVALT